MVVQESSWVFGGLGMEYRIIEMIFRKEKLKSYEQLGFIFLYRGTVSSLVYGGTCSDSGPRLSICRCVDFDIDMDAGMLLGTVGGRGKAGG